MLPSSLTHEMMLFKKKPKSSLELWQSTLDKTNQEILSGKYRVKFSAFETFIFPKPTLLQKWTLKFLSPLFRKAKHLYKRLFPNPLKNLNRLSNTSNEILYESI